MEEIQDCGLSILNRKTEGDWEREFTYVGGRGNSVIDYIFVNVCVQDRIRTFKVEDRVDSDHSPISMEMKWEKEEDEEEGRDGKPEEEKKEEEEEIKEGKRIKEKTKGL